MNATITYICTIIYFVIYYVYCSIECEEIYYDSKTGHIVICTIASDNDHFSTIDMPIEDIVVTYGTFEGTLTLRCTTNSAPEDYIATIKSDDWRRIIAQVWITLLLINS
jgi:hypothetical protein